MHRLLHNIYLFKYRANTKSILSYNITMYTDQHRTQAGARRDGPLRGGPAGAPIYGETSESRNMRAYIESHLREAGVHGESLDWVIRALHPSAAEVRPAGLPDASSSYCVRPNFRVQAEVAAPPNCNQWDAMLFTAPGDINAVYIATAPSPAEFGSPNIPPDARFQVIRLQEAATTEMAMGLQGVLGWGDFVGGPPPSSTPMSAQAIIGSFPSLLTAGKSAAFRTMYAGLTVHLVASAVSDQGTVYAAQYPANPVDRGLVCVDSSAYSVPRDFNAATCPQAYLQHVYTGPATLPVIGTEAESVRPINPTYVARAYEMVLPTNETDLASTAPGYLTLPAREGVYVPLRLSGPSQPYVRAAPTGGSATMLTDVGGVESAFGRTLANTAALVVPPIFPPFSTDVGDGYRTAASDTMAAVGVIPLFIPSLQTSAAAIIAPNSSTLANVPWPFQLAAGYSGTPIPAGTLGVIGSIPPIAFDTGFNNMNNAFVLFRGLQGGSNGGFASSLQVKFMTGLEIVPSPSALDRVFVERPAPYDPTALEMYYRYALLFADAYPASYNSWSDLWDKVKDAAEYIWNGAVKPIARAVLPGAAGQLADYLEPGSSAMVRPIVSGLLGAPPESRGFGHPSAERHAAIEIGAVSPSDIRRQLIDARRLPVAHMQAKARKLGRKAGWVDTPVRPLPSARKPTPKRA